MPLPHIHVGVIDFLVTGAYIIIFAFLWRALAIKWSDHAVGQAMATIL